MREAGCRIGNRPSLVQYGPSKLIKSSSGASHPSPTFACDSGCYALQFTNPHVGREMETRRWGTWANGTVDVIADSVAGNQGSSTGLEQCARLACRQEDGAQYSGIPDKYSLLFAAKVVWLSPAAQ